MTPASCRTCWSASPSASRRTPTSSSRPRTRTRSSGCRWPAAPRWTRCAGCSPTDNLRLVGLHSHIGSQIFDVAGFELAAHRVIGLLRDVVAEFGVEKTAQISIVDLGGGLGISYLPQDDPPPVDDLAAKLGAIVRNESAAVGLPAPKLVVEPGRAIAGPGTITLYEVGTVKDVAVSVRQRTGATSASTAA